MSATGKREARADGARREAGSEGVGGSEGSGGRGMGGMSRREAVGVLAALPLAAAIDWSPEATDRAARAAQGVLAARAAGGGAYAPTFFTAHEWATVRVLVDLIIPRDARSGSATDAGVPEFMDFMMTDRPRNQTTMRGGLAWMDAECRRRFDKTFVACTDAERRALLDDIAWPDRARPEMSHGVAFFNWFRDLTASGFWSSKMGVEDLRYQGNTFVREWTGCPPAALAKLGVSYGEAG